MANVSKIITCIDAQVMTQSGVSIIAKPLMYTNLTHWVPFFPSEQAESHGEFRRPQLPHPSQRDMHDYLGI